MHDDAAGLLANNPSLKSWAQLKTFFLERSGEVALTLQELFSLRQQGTVHAHYDAVLALCARVPGMTEAEVTRWFVSGLVSEFSVELKGFSWLRREVEGRVDIVRSGTEKGKVNIAFVSEKFRVVGYG